MLENKTAYYRKEQVHLTLFSFINWAAVHIKPVCFLNSVAFFKLFFSSGYGTLRNEIRRTLSQTGKTFNIDSIFFVITVIINSVKQ